MTLAWAATYRLTQAAITMFVVSVIAFSLLRLVPGDPGALLYGPTVSASELAQVRERWGLDAPLHVQYLRWLFNALSGDLGRSYVDGRPVVAVIGERIPATVALAAAALFLATVAGLTVGVVSARSGSVRLDRLVRVLTTAIYSTPPFWLGILLVLLFSVGLGWFPSGGSADPRGDGSPADFLRHLILPAIALAARDAARFARLTRASMLDVAQQDFVRTASAKGLSRATIETRHVLRNALLPIFALLGVAIPGVLSGAVVLETVFAWPGVGRLALEAALQRNYPVLMGEVLVVAAAAMVASVLADLASALADPRVRRRNVA